MSLKQKLFVHANRALQIMPRGVQRHFFGALSHLPLVHNLPRFIAIEPTNNCNLKCPLCPVGAGTMDRDHGFMDIQAYKKLVDEIAPHTRRVLMNFAGEPLLHPNIGQMVRYAEDRGVEITLGTHGNINKMQDLIEARVSEVLFSLDGTTQETYGQYRVGGSLDSALENLGKIVEARNSLPNSPSKIILQFVVMKHNHHQIDDLVALGRKFGVDQISLQPVCVNDFFEDEHTALIDRWVPDQSPYLLHPEALELGKITRPPLCVWALQSVVLFNGDVTLCCFDADGRVVVGNAFEEGGFKKVWNSPRYRKSRKGILLQDFDICKKCDVGLVKPTRFSPQLFGHPAQPHAEGDQF